MPSLRQRVAEFNKRQRFVKIAEARVSRSCLQFSVNNETYYILYEDLNRIVSDSTLDIPVYVLRNRFENEQDV